MNEGLGLSDELEDNGEEVDGFHTPVSGQELLSKRNGK